ncbi:MAG: DUF4011 domain-containing protein [Rothia sp. (in: high G+C Gram-positive bacteria)]|nr:DUF4011 domain-containing protein [Rothia sp. (in: high G+C Gram-positive bacteria)]
MKNHLAGTSLPWDPQQKPGGTSPAGESDQQQSPQDDPEKIQAGLRYWQQELRNYTGPETLLYFEPQNWIHIDLSQANPSGLAQLLMGRRTRLSTILNNKTSFEAASQAAGALTQKIRELQSQHCIEAGYLAAGLAHWTSYKTPDQSQVQRLAPILLNPVTITAHPAGKDFDLRLHGTASLNPGLVRQLYRDYGLDLSSIKVGQLANSMAKLNPEPVIDAVRAATSSIADISIHSTYLTSTFADLATDKINLLQSQQTSPLLKQLALLPSKTARPKPAPLTQEALPLDERPLETEILLYQADSAAQEIIDLASQGKSFTITAAPGTQGLKTACNIAATLISQGKSVLVLGEKEASIQEFTRLLAHKNLAHLVYNLLDKSKNQDQRQQLIQAIVNYEQTKEPNLQASQEELGQVRSKLAHHTASLTGQQEPWGCSIYDALQKLAALTRQEPAPTTAVRLNKQTLASLADRSQALEKLNRLAQLAAFQPATEYSAWRKAKLNDKSETEAAFQLVQNLTTLLGSLRNLMNSMSAKIGMRSGHTLREWSQQLDLLERMQETLTYFRVEVYDRPVTDLIAATATGSWRREHGVEMSSMQRSRLRKAAREYILPGVHLIDLYQNLLIVQAEREEWISWSDQPQEPVIPANLKQLRQDLGELEQEFSGLAYALEDSPEGNDFLNTDIDQLIGRLRRLTVDKDLLASLPERNKLIQQLESWGLADLLADLRQRQVKAEQVADELELAWWQSALELMLSSHGQQILDGNTLRDLEETFRQLDAAHQEASPARLQALLAKNWKERILADKGQASFLKDQLRAADFDFEEVLRQAPKLVTALLPLWLASPFSLSLPLAAQLSFDLLLILDSASTPLAASLPAISRAQQVISMGDPHSDFSQPFEVATANKPAASADTASLSSTHAVLEQLLAGRHLSLVLDRAVDPLVLDYLNSTFYGGGLRTYPWAEEANRAELALSFEPLAASSEEAGAGSGKASLAREVDRVVEAVFEQARLHPHQSLAVITAESDHAQRISWQIQQQLEYYPHLQSFFKAEAAEPFRVRDLGSCQEIERDVVIFSLGVRAADMAAASRPWGLLSSSKGRAYFVQAVSRARHLTRLISAALPPDLDETGLSSGALDLYRLLRQLEQRQHQKPQEQQALNQAVISAAFDGEDWLLADVLQRLEDRGGRFWPQAGPGLAFTALSEREALLAGSIPSSRVRRMGESGQGQVSFPLAAWTDGSASYARASVRERSRFVPDILRRTGWNYMTLWSVEVFSNPEAVTDRLALYLGLAAKEKGKKRTKRNSG